MHIRRLRPGEGARLRDLRLRALADAPYAFATTLADAQELPTKAWEERAQRQATDERNVMFVAEDGDRWCGLAGGYFPQDQPDVPQLYSMWVAPEHRRSGLGLLLVEAVAEWARERGAKEITLWVTKVNEAARDFYRRAGFVETTDTRPPDSDEGPEADLLRRAL